MQQPGTDIADLVYKIAVHHDEYAYQQLFYLLYPKIKNFALAMLKSNELAEEVACDTLFALWANRHKLIQVDNVKLYAYVVAKNKVLNIIKKKSADRMVLVDEIDINISFHELTPEQILINQELKTSIEQMVQALPPRCKLVFKLIKEDGLSYKEVAQILNISVKTVDAQLVTAIKRIAAVIKKEYNLAT